MICRMQCKKATTRAYTPEVRLVLSAWYQYTVSCFNKFTFCYIYSCYNTSSCALSGPGCLNHYVLHFWHVSSRYSQYTPIHDFAYHMCVALLSCGTPLF